MVPWRAALFDRRRARGVYRHRTRRRQGVVRGWGLSASPARGRAGGPHPAPGDESARGCVHSGFPLYGRKRLPERDCVALPASRATECPRPDGGQACEMPQRLRRHFIRTTVIGLAAPALHPASSLDQRSATTSSAPSVIGASPGRSSSSLATSASESSRSGIRVAKRSRSTKERGWEESFDRGEDVTAGLDLSKARREDSKWRRTEVVRSADGRVFRSSGETTRVPPARRPSRSGSRKRSSSGGHGRDQKLRQHGA